MPPPITSGWVDYPGTWEEFQQRSQMNTAERERIIAQRRRELQGLKIVSWETLEEQPKERDALIRQVADIFKKKVKSDELASLLQRMKEKEGRAMQELESTGRFDESELSITSRVTLELMHPICLELQIRLDVSTYSKLVKAALNLIAKEI